MKKQKEKINRHEVGRKRERERAGGERKGRVLREILVNDTALSAEKSADRYGRFSAAGAPKT